MLRPWVFVGFIGHRRLEDPEKVAGAIRSALQRIRSGTDAPLAAVSSLAGGADMLFVEAVVAERIPWQLMLPFAPEAFFNARDFTPEEIVRAEALARRAVDRHVVWVEPDAGPTGAARRDAFAECGLRTVDECHVLVAVWNGQPAAGRGGTAESVDYARQLGKPLIVIDPGTGALREENFEALSSSVPNGMEGGAPSALDPRLGGLPELQATLEAHDRQAVQLGPAAGELVTRVIFLHLAATAIALLALFLPQYGLMLGIGFVLVMVKIAALIYADRLQHSRQHLHQGWLHHRIVAELCRSAAGTWPLACAPRVTEKLAVPGFREWQRTVWLWRLVAPPVEFDFAAAREAYAKGRVQEQIEYYERQLRGAEEKLGRGRTLAAYATRLAIICGVGALALALHHAWPALMALAGFSPPTADSTWSADALRAPLKLMSLVLPLVSASALHWVVAHDCRRRAVRYRDMKAFLERSQQKVRQAASPGSLERLAGEIETTLMLEVFEWHSVSQFAGEAH